MMSYIGLIESNQVEMDVSFAVGIYNNQDHVVLKVQVILLVLSMLNNISNRKGKNRKNGEKLYIFAFFSCGQQRYLCLFTSNKEFKLKLYYLEFSVIYFLDNLINAYRQLLVFFFFFFFFFFFCPNRL